MSTAPKPQPISADPVKVDANHYTVESENDRVRVLRVRYGPVAGMAALRGGWRGWQGQPPLLIHGGSEGANSCLALPDSAWAALGGLVFFALPT